MTGYVHSIQSLGAVDGPGVRYVVFMQGCPLRCVYCHNPDTWLTEGGEEYTADELVRKALRFRPYWRNGGGVSVTGGEPLLQAAFVEEFFAKLHEHGVHTALDTSGVGNLAAAERVLRHTDLVLCDLKFLTKAEYRQYCRADFGQVERFLQLTAMKIFSGEMREKTIRYSYDEAGRLIGKQLPGRNYTDYRYNAAGKLEEILHKGADKSAVAGNKCKRNERLCV